MKNEVVLMIAAFFVSPHKQREDDMEQNIFEVMWQNTPFLTLSITIAIISGWAVYKIMRMYARFESRFVTVETRLTVVETKLDALDKKVEKLSDKVDKLSDKLDRLVEALLVKPRDP